MINPKTLLKEGFEYVDAGPTFETYYWKKDDLQITVNRHKWGDNLWKLYLIQGEDEIWFEKKPTTLDVLRLKKALEYLS